MKNQKENTDKGIWKLLVFLYFIVAKLSLFECSHVHQLTHYHDYFWTGDNEVEKSEQSQNDPQNLKFLLGGSW